MDEEMCDVKHLNTVERLLHAFHMQEMWRAAAVIYKEMVKEPPSETSLCSCLTDVDNNGVYHQLRVTALNIREPELMNNPDKRDEHETKTKLQREGRTIKYWIDGTGVIDTGHWGNGREKAVEEARQ